MASVLRIVDEDLTTTLFDLNDDTGLNNAVYGSSLKTEIALGGAFALNAPDMHFVDFQPGSLSGGFTVHSRAGIASSQWNQRCFSTSYDNLVAGLGALSNFLRQGCILKWQPENATPKFMDVLPSPSPALFDGKELELHHVIQAFDTRKGVTIAIRRQPYLRGLELTPAVNVLANPLLIQDVTLDGRPDSWTWDTSANITAESISASEEAYQFTVSTATARNLQQVTGAASAAPGDVWAFQFEAESDSASAKCQAVIEYLSAASGVLATHTGTLTTLTTAPQRLSIVTTAAPASTDKVRVSLRVDNDDATGRVVRWRKPQLAEEATVTPFRVGPQSVPMDPELAGGKAIAVFVQGDAPAPVVVTATLDAGSTVQQLLVARRSSGAVQGRRRLPDYLNETNRCQLEATGDGWTVTLSSDTAAVTDGTDASGPAANDVAEVASAGASTTSNAKRVRATRTTKLDSLRGTFRVYARVKASASSIWKCEMRWSPSLASPASYSNPVVTHDLSTNGAPATFGYVMLDMGTIQLPAATSITLAGLALEFWCYRVSGTGSLRADYFWLVPDDERVGRVRISGEGSTEFWLGSELVTPVSNPAGGTAGAVQGTQMKLDDTADNAGTPPNTGMAWPVGRHTVTFSLVRSASASPMTCNVRIRNITDSTNDATQSVTLQPSEAKEVTLILDSVSGKSYQPQVDDPSQINQLRVVSIAHAFVPTGGSGEKVRTDPGSVPSRYIAEKLDSSNNVLQSLSVEGDVPVICEPGLNLLAMDAIENAIANYAEGQHLNARVLNVSCSHAPRFHA